MRDFLLRVATAIAACAAVSAPLPAQVPEPATAFTGVTVITMTDPLPRSGQTVVVRGGRIEAVGPDAEVQIPEGALEVPGEGAYLLPGLVDAHVHLEWTPDTSDLLLYVANGVTTVRSMDGRAHLLDWAEEISAGRMLGPDIVSAGMVIDGRDRVYDETAVATTPAEGRRIVADQADTGFRFVKVYDALAPDVYAAIVAEAERRGMPVVGHIPDAVDIEWAVRAGHRSVEHFNGFAPVIAADSASAEEMRFLAVPVDSAAVERLADVLADHGVFVVPTLTAFSRAAPAERAREWFDRPEHAYMHPQLTEGWAYLYYNYAFRPPAFFAALEDGERSRALVARILHREGVPLAVGTDAPLLSVEPGFAVHRELAHFVDAGLEPYEALRAATVTSARLLGMVSEIGTIAEGKRADLLLVGSNPLEDLSTLRRPLGVMVAGRWVPRAELDRRMETLARSNTRPKNDFAAAPNQEAWVSEDVYLYTYEFRGRPLGLERTRRESDTFMAQAVTDNPEDVWYELRWDLGERDRGLLLQLASWGEPQSMRVAVSRKPDSVTISTSGGGDAVDTVLPLPDEGLLIGPGLAGLMPVASVAMQLGAGESTTLPVAGVWIEDAPEVVQGSVTIERRADSLNRREFDLEFAFDGGREEESRLVLDAAGEPLSWTWDHPVGQFRYIRSQPEPQGEPSDRQARLPASKTSPEMP